MQVGDHQLGLSVERLDHDQRERTAAVLAWLTLDAITMVNGDAGSTAWHEFVNDVLQYHVTFSMPDTQPTAVGAAWWSEAVSRALTQFIRENDLGARINRHMEAFAHMGRPPAG